MGNLDLTSLGIQANKVKREDKPIHNWYRFVLSYPPHLVKYYLEKFEVESQDFVLDPFCGTGTTLIEAKLNGINSIGIEANPVVRFASQTKLSWSILPQDLIDCALEIAFSVNKKLKRQGIDDQDLKSIKEITLKEFSKEHEKIILTDSISPLPLHKVLVLLNEIKTKSPDALRDHLLLAYLKMVVKDASNLRFGPEIGLGVIKTDSKILNPWLSNIQQIATDIAGVNISTRNINSEVILGDARNVNQYISPNSIQAVITSPPYPNEKDYSRTTRLESVLLGLINNNDELRSIKKTFVRSNTRSVYKEDKDHLYIKSFDSIQKIAQEIENKRIELNKNSGFEKMYSKVTLQYFGGMAKHLSNLRNVLKPGAKLAYVVGDQASYLRVMIKTGNLIAEIAESLGYKVLDIELFRTRFATASKQQLKEEAVILEWTGKS